MVTFPAPLFTTYI